MIDYTYNKVNTTYFSPNDFEYLSELKKNLSESTNKNTIISFLKKYSTISINSILRSIETDIKGLFELDNSDFRKYFLKEKFNYLTKEDIFEQIIIKTESIKEGEFELSETLYEIKTIKIVYNNEIIPVKEVLTSYFEFTLLESLIIPYEYYLEVIIDGLFIDVRIYKIKEKDIPLVKGLNKSKISTLARKYLKSN